MSAGGSDGRHLELSLDQQAALEALEAFGTAFYDEESRRTGRQAPGLGGAMLRASMAVASAGLPDCPYAPPGHSLEDNRWSSNAPPRLVLRCTHDEGDGGPHCWDKTGMPVGC